MAGGVPVPIPTSDEDEQILSIKHLERVGSRKLAQVPRGMFNISLRVGFVVILRIHVSTALSPVLFLSIHLCSTEQMQAA